LLPVFVNSLCPTLTGGIWKEAPCVQDGNLVTATAWPDNPEFLKLIIKALGGKIHGSGKKILMLCGVCPIGKRKKLRKLGDSFALEMQSWILFKKHHEFVGIECCIVFNWFISDTCAGFYGGL
jgi:hypothetical protein